MKELNDAPVGQPLSDEEAYAWAFGNLVRTEPISGPPQSLWYALPSGLSWQSATGDWSGSKVGQGATPPDAIRHLKSQVEGA